MSSTERHNYTMGYSLVVFFYWGIFCSMVSYASYYLLSIGFRNSTIGVLIAVAGIFSALLQPMIAGYADRQDSMSLKKILLIIVGIQVAGYIILFGFHGRIMMVSGIVYAMEIGLQQLVTPLMNALGTETLNQKKRLNYGVSRAMGSVGYAAIALLLGIITAKTDSSMLLLCSMILLILLEFFLLIYPFEKQKKTTENSAEKPAGGFAFFKRYPRFTIVLAGCVMIYIGHVFINNFTLQVVQSKGAGTAEMGTGQALASILELPTMFLFGWMLKMAGSRFWFRISGIFFFLKILLTMLAPTIPIFYGVQGFQMFGWALITVSSVYYVNNIMREEDRIKGQAYFTMTYTIGSVIGAILGGMLLELFSANRMMGVGSVISFIGAAIIFLTA